MYSHAHSLYYRKDIRKPPDEVILHYFWPILASTEKVRSLRNRPKFLLGVQDIYRYGFFWKILQYTLYVYRLR